MVRTRVSSFISQWSPEGRRNQSSSSSPVPVSSTPSPPSSPLGKPTLSNTTVTNYPSESAYAASMSPSTYARQRSASRTGSRPASMIQTFQPPLMDVAQDTLPELLPIFTYLNSHSNKMYHEGYFLKLHDLDSRGRPSANRTWQECFAQLCGTILSIWDASELDEVAEGSEEVTPVFINVSDASIKMIESLPMNDAASKHLQNVLSVSTAANNRYLFHFSNLHSLTQWAAAIRLAMYESTSLQEAYTGSLIAAKGKSLNNIRLIMEQKDLVKDDWARVRFGATTPWRRCWYVVSPPNPKQVKAAQKEMKKRPFADKVAVRGDVKFYANNRVSKRTKPIATIKDAYSAYAIYPQSKPLIEQSTLVKIEGKITVHQESETVKEGFIFVMPEIHPAVSGLEMMLRFLFPVWDAFHLYGRPNRLAADALDQRGLMFAMPRTRQYGYLELLDVAGLIHTPGSANWSDRDWRTNMRKLTSERMIVDKDKRSSPPDTVAKVNASRISLPPTRNGRLQVLQFDDTPHHSPEPSAPPSSSYASSLRRWASREGLFRSAFGSRKRNHRRFTSDSHHAADINPVSNSAYSRPVSAMAGGRAAAAAAAAATVSAPVSHGATPSAYTTVPGTANATWSHPSPSRDASLPPSPPPHGLHQRGSSPVDSASDSSGKESSAQTPDPILPPEVQRLAESSPPPGPVSMPPPMMHAPSSKPIVKVHRAPGRVAMDSETLDTLKDVSQNKSAVNFHHASGETWPAPQYQEAQNPQPNSMLGGQQFQYYYQQPAPPPLTSNRFGGTSGQHVLPTIPASPYIDQFSPTGEQSSTSYFTDSQAIPPPPPPHSNNNFTVVNRKPVPISMDNTTESSSRRGNSIVAAPIIQRRNSRPNTSGSEQRFLAQQNLSANEPSTAAGSFQMPLPVPPNGQGQSQMTPGGRPLSTASEDSMPYPAAHKKFGSLSSPYDAITRHMRQTKL